MIDLNLKPSETQLRQFAWVSLLGFPLISGLLLYLTLGLSLTVVLSVAAAGPAVLLVGLINPKLVWPVYALLMLIALPIGLVVSAVLLRLIYYMLFTPIALWFRLTGKDAMKRGFEPETDSYWTVRTVSRDPASYLRLY
jgi:hypothetical protein